MMDDLILIALHEEAPNLAKLGNVYYTGVGKVNAALTAANLIACHRPKRVFNFGTAGGITKGPGLHECRTFSQRDFVVSGVLGIPNDKISLPGAGLHVSTGDNFVTDSTSIDADLVDMEAYAIARACQLAEVDFICYKYVSDFADDAATDSFLSNVHKGEDHYIEILKEYGVQL